MGRRFAVFDSFFLSFLWGRAEEKKTQSDGNKDKDKEIEKDKKQGRIHGRTVKDGWVGAVMQKPLAISK